MILGVRRAEYLDRISKLRPLLQVFRNGRLEVGASGGARGMLFIRTSDKEEFFVGGAQPDIAHALAEAVNLVLDLVAREAERGDDRRPGVGGAATPRR